MLERLAARADELRAHRDLGVSANSRRGPRWVRSRASSSTPARAPSTGRCRYDYATGARSTSSSPTRRSPSRRARCMDCGIPFCMPGLPPRQSHSRPSTTTSIASSGPSAADQLFSTNNFPEFTGRLCPAPCESACVLGIVERSRHDRARSSTRSPSTPSRAASPSRRATPRESGRRVAVVGSGPAGTGRRRAAAQRGSRGRASTSAATPSAVCCATASPSSRWKSASSIADWR